MNKEEVALQLTLSRLDKLTYTKCKGENDLTKNAEYNEMLAIETAKMYNTVYNNLDLNPKE